MTASRVSGPLFLPFFRPRLGWAVSRHRKGAPRSLSALFPVCLSVREGVLDLFAGLLHVALGLISLRYTVVHSVQVVVLFAGTCLVDAVVFGHGLLGAGDPKGFFTRPRV